MDLILSSLTFCAATKQHIFLFVYLFDCRCGVFLCWTFPAKTWGARSSFFSNNGKFWPWGGGLSSRNQTIPQIATTQKKIVGQTKTGFLAPKKNPCCLIHLLISVSSVSFQLLLVVSNGFLIIGSTVRHIDWLLVWKKAAWCLFSLFLQTFLRWKQVRRT